MPRMEPMAAPITVQADLFNGISKKTTPKPTASQPIHPQFAAGEKNGCASLKGLESSRSDPAEYEKTTHDQIRHDLPHP